MDESDDSSRVRVCMTSGGQSYSYSANKVTLLASYISVSFK
jgi:hypothetical protein